jgi:gas vesicle protein
MAERTDELRKDIDRRRENISRTVDQVQNRVSPGRMVARGRHRVRRWIVDIKDQVMGNNEPYYSWQQRETNYLEPQSSQQKGKDMTDRISETASHVGERASEMASEVGDRVSDAASEVKEAVSHAPQRLRQQTRGNPAAAGLIAFGSGLLLGGILPGTRVERDLAQRMEPAMSTAMVEAKDAGREIAEELKEGARESMEAVKEAGSEAGEHLKEDVKEAAERTKDRT